MLKDIFTKVYENLGKYHSKEIYKKAFEIELRQANLNPVIDETFPIYYLDKSGPIIGEFTSDFTINSTECIKILTNKDPKTMIKEVELFKNELKHIYMNIGYLFFIDHERGEVHMTKIKINIS